MSVSRPGLWIADGLIMVFFALGLNTTTGEGLGTMFAGGNTLREAAEVIYMYNMLLPLVAGILAADRTQRDFRLKLWELQASSPLKHWTYVLGKYLGVVFSTLLPALVFVLLYGGLAVVAGLTPPVFILAELVAFVAIVVPACAFVTAFSLACPLVMPLRVYQILFTGYWFWGNYINNNFIPTISGTLLNASGIYAVQAFFRSQAFNAVPGAAIPAPLDAWLNLLVLSVCVLVALFTLERYLNWQSKCA